MSPMPDPRTLRKSFDYQVSIKLKSGLIEAIYTMQGTSMADAVERATRTATKLSVERTMTVSWAEPDYAPPPPDGRFCEVVTLPPTPATP